MRMWISRRRVQLPPGTLTVSCELEATMTSDVLDLPTLVLNRQWQPVHVTTVARSLVLLWNDAARVVDPDEYRLYVVGRLGFS